MTEEPLEITLHCSKCDKTFPLLALHHCGENAHTPDWQPIETAPRDETPIEIYANVATVDCKYLAWWDDGEHWKEAQFDSKGERMGWWYATSSNGQAKVIITPTHWRYPDLPQPPKGDE